VRAKLGVTPGVGLVRRLGPGLITGATDDDPSGIATYSQVGAQFGYGLPWTMLFSLPFMIGRIGAMTGRGIAENLRRHYSPWLVRSVVLLLLVAILINRGADLGTMGSALALLLEGARSFHRWVRRGGRAGRSVLDYALYAGFLKWLTASLFAYVAVVLTAHVA
jgi:hypothetical protein